MPELIPRRLRPRRFWLRQPWRFRLQKFPRSSVPSPPSSFVLHLRSDSAPNPVGISHKDRDLRSSNVIGLAPEPIIGGIMHLFYKSWLAAAMVAVAVVLSVGAANAQSGGSSISGTVLDPSGAVVANARVEIHNAVSGFDRTTTTDSKGNFNFPNVPFNPYHMTVTAAGFAQTRAGCGDPVGTGRECESQFDGGQEHRHGHGRGWGGFGGERSDRPHRRGSGIVRQDSPGKPVLVREFAGHARGTGSGCRFERPVSRTGRSRVELLSVWTTSPSPISKARFFRTRFRSIRSSRWRSFLARRRLNTEARRAW